MKTPMKHIDTTQESSLRERASGRISAVSLGIYTSLFVVWLIIQLQR